MDGKISFNSSILDSRTLFSVKIKVIFQIPLQVLSLIRNNGGEMRPTSSSIAEIPNGYAVNSRIEREWSIIKTNFAQNFNCELELSSNTFLNGFSSSDLIILIDDNGDFSDGGPSGYINGDETGITLSYSGDLITINGISTTHIPNNSTKYFTLGVASNSAPPFYL